MAYVTVREPNGRRIHALGAQTIIGRGATCSIVLTDPLSSKQHTEIRAAGERFRIRDLQSTNGTHAGGRAITEEIELQDGDEIVIGSTTLIFTRTAPPFGDADLRIEPGRETKDSGALSAVPSGTTELPLEQFGLRQASAPEGEAPTLLSADLDTDVGLCMRNLYRLLREANQCATEDELFTTATRLIAETLSDASVRILFEAEEKEKEAPPEKEKEKERARRATLNLTSWSDPNRRARKTVFMDDRFLTPRTALLSYARSHCVALLSPNVDADARVSPEVKSSRKTTRVLKDAPSGDASERVSLLIAPLLVGRTVLGYLIAERMFRITPGGDMRQNRPFSRAHLEFLAAAAYPLATMVVNLRRWQSAQDEASRLRQSTADRYQIVGNSPELMAQMSVVQRIAPANSHVLILGESGTGKELVARAVHALSPRQKGPFEVVNCAALPENLIESELFGHVKGSFTGAVNDRAGYFELASSGTLFLDEIGELPLQSQVKLLRVLEDGRVARVGETRLRDCDCRIVAATNRDLEKEVKAGRFRQDLYFRLSVVAVTMPALRNRMSDLQLLCTHLLKPFGRFTLHPDVFEIFRQYGWPGNIRELRNTLERMAVLSRSGPMSRMGQTQLQLADIPLDIRRAVESLEPQGEPPVMSNAAKTTVAAQAVLNPDSFGVRAEEMPSIEQLQAEYARWVLKQVGGNKSKAAKILGVQRSTLYSWID